MGSIGAKPTATITRNQPTSPPTSTPTPKVAKEELKVKILNGSGTAGKAGEARDLLKEKGYQEILTGNADSFDYEQTEIQVKKNGQDILGAIKTDLKENVKSFKESTLSESEAADVVIIIGTDFK